MFVPFLGPDFAATWSGKPGRRYQSKKEQVRRKIGLLAHDINRKYFEEALSGNYGAMGKLREISTMLDDACSGVSVCRQVIVSPLSVLIVHTL